MQTPQLENGHLRIATELIEAFCQFRVPGEVTQIIFSIIRKTYGFNKKEDWISGSQLMKMTGMKKQNIYRTVKKAIDHKLILKKDNKLRLNKNYAEWVSFGKSNQKGLPVIKSDYLKKVIKSDYPSNQKGLPEVIKSDGHNIQTTKDNIQKTPDVAKIATPPQEYKNKNEQTMNGATDVVRFLEETLRTKIVMAGKQKKAHHMMIEAGYTDKQIKYTIKKMATDTYWAEKGFDLMVVANHIHEYKAKAERMMQLYGK